MRKYIVGAFFGILLSFTTVAFSASTLQKVDAYLRPDFNVNVDGKAVKLNAVPIVYDGSTYLPVREISGILNKKVDWKDETLTIEIKQNGIIGNPVFAGDYQERIATEAGYAYTGNITRRFEYEGIKAIEYKGVEYFSRTEFNDKYADRYKSAAFKPFEEVSYEEGTIFRNKDGSETARVRYPGKEGYWIVFEDGSTWINTEYYPDDFRK